ncbi:hypothetical protein BDV25DRAFT_154097 [Aspergillus avenaceus]|uniref:Gamma interferon inducible lysosomal thiol reductase-domain-containing protein n=1 Tax=Aspergillus avenaceus TaxID=36643 RepID=A0A5N6TW31_ASPAV|nr:hypothetical protein BDV25DRAFT_154097 [Aspergillus avenaceus]
MEKSETPTHERYEYVPVSTPPDGDAVRTRRGRSVARLAMGLSLVSLLLLSSMLFALPNIHLHSCHKAMSKLREGFLSPFTGAPQKAPIVVSSSRKVPLEAHVMSKCPDAQDCLQQLVVPAMERVSEKVDFDLSFIASVSNQSSDIDCKHGPGECIGDMLILCAQNLPFSSEDDGGEVSRMPVIRSLGFANCLISSYPEIPDRTLAQNCALQHGIDFEALNSCVSKQEDETGNDSLSGLALLRKSALHSAELGVSTSCTVRLDESVWCVRDSGVWKDCAHAGEASKVSELVEEIEKLWDQKNQS